MIAVKRDAYANEYESPDYGRRELQVIENTGAKKKAVLRRDRFFMVAGVLCIFSLALLYTFMTAGITQGGYAINTLKADIAAIENQNHRLTLEIEEKSSLKRIEGLAKTELGMVASNGKNVYYVAMEGAAPGAENNQQGQQAQTATANTATAPESNGNGSPAFLAFNKLFFE